MWLLGLPGSVAGTTNEPVTSSFGPTPGWPCKQAPGGEPGVPAGSGDQRELLARLRAVIEAKDAENAVLRAELQAQRERYRQLELRAAELERRLGSDSTTSGTPAETRSSTATCTTCMTARRRVDPFVTCRGEPRDDQPGRPGPHERPPRAAPRGAGDLRRLDAGPAHRGSALRIQRSAAPALAADGPRLRRDRRPAYRRADRPQHHHRKPVQADPAIPAGGHLRDGPRGSRAPSAGGHGGPGVER